MLEENKLQLIKLARQAIASEFSDKEIHIPIELQNILTEKRGVFVTLYKNKSLRGCIGFPEPTLRLGIALIKAAKYAAFEDSRFAAVKESELKSIQLEITLLTKPKKIKPDPKKIKIGEDGLIVRQGHYSGLLLPQVATEYNWDAKKFLEQTSLKAGLDKDAWKDSEVYTFQGEIIKEKL